MNCRRAMQTDYDELCEWWVAHEWSPVPLEMLPTGWVIEKDDKLLAAGFLYIAGNAPVAYFEYVVTNPDNTRRESYKAVDLLFAEVMKFVEYNLIKVCFARIKSHGLQKMYEKHGFAKGDALTDMVWREK